MKIQILSLVSLFLAFGTSELQAADTTPEANAGGFRVKLHLPSGVTFDNYRVPAAARAPELVYVTFDNKGKTKHVAQINEKIWRGEERGIRCSSSSTAKAKFTDGDRYTCLKNMYFANTKDRSNSGLRHVACYLGDPVLLAKAFFNPANSATAIKYLDRQKGLDISTSTDRYAMGIEGRLLAASSSERDRDFYFRIPSCNAPGKNTILPDSIARSPASAGDDAIALPLSDSEKTELQRLVDAPAYRPEGRSPQSTAQYGFKIGDSLHPADEAAGKKLGRYKFLGRYDQAASKWSEGSDRPWKGMDIRTVEGQKKFALVLLQYAYEGLANQHKSWRGAQSIPQNERVLYAQYAKRYWCHMPWLNGDATGREVIHGLTKERDLAPSSIFKNPPPASDWGIGFYNAKACQTIGKIFGSSRKPIEEPDFARSHWKGFGDGSVAAKFLFTTGKFPEVEGAHVMKANVSGTKGQNDRRLQDVRLIQIDIGVKDSSLKGARKDLDHWVMTTYYFDANYDVTKDDSSFGARDYLPGFLKMRPQGIQIGLGLPPQDTTIFAGAVSNGVEGRLNGPADNPKGSCLGCHAAAGTTTPMVPGIMADADYKAVASTALEFSQQLALARRNSETKPQWVVLAEMEEESSSEE